MPHADVPVDATADQREAYEERAAIREFEGGLTRAEAECRARAIVWAGASESVPVATDPWEF